MGKFIPTEIDDYFFIDIVLIFLMVNFDLPLATIYSSFVILGALMYYVAADQRLFTWIPILKKGKNPYIAIGIGVGIGYAFLQFYSYLASGTPLGDVFATTAFGESDTLRNLILTFIGFIETRFFFRTVLQWWTYKTRQSTKEVFSFDGISLMVIFGAIFTVFHATTKGLTNNQDLIATFVLGAVSVGIILYTQNLMEALVFHVFVNGAGTGLWKTIFNVAFLSNVWVMGGIGIIAFLVIKNKRVPLFS